MYLSSYKRIHALSKKTVVLRRWVNEIRGGIKRVNEHLITIGLEG